MSGAEVAIPYVAAALGINQLYGSVTGESGGLIGEAFGVQDKIDQQTAQAKQEALDRQTAQSQQTADAIKSLTLPSVTPPAAQVVPMATPVAPTTPVAPAVEKPTLMPVASQVNQVAQRESILAQRRRQGRASTILTSDTLG